MKTKLKPTTPPNQTKPPKPKNLLVKDFVDVGLCFGRRLEERTSAKLASQVFALFSADDTLVVQIALVANQDHRHIVAVLDAQDLFAQVGKVVEGRLRNNRVDEHKALAVLHVQIAHGRELLRAGRIENLEHALLVVDLDLLAVRVLDGRVLCVRARASP